MLASHRVIKNSIFLIIQAMILNIISIFATGYIARTLGGVCYGRFVFGLCFINIIMPISHMGLRALMVREIAKEHTNCNEYVEKMVTLRLILSLVAIMIACAAVNILRYQSDTKQIVYILSFIIIFQTITTIMFDIFQAIEEMKYIAYIQFTSGFILTALSAIVMYFRYGLVTLAVVYVIGNMLGAALACYYLVKRLRLPTLRFDWSFWCTSLYRGFPFFLPILLAFAGSRIGIVLLSKYAGDAYVGFYGAANTLVEKLLIISDAICTAFFPAMAALYKRSPQEAARLYQKFSVYILLMGFPLSLGTTILAKEIIVFIYGKSYIQSTVVLQVLVWWLFFNFLTSFQAWTIGAINQEKKGAVICYIASLAYLLFNIILIPLLMEVGAAVANLVVAVCTFLLFSFVVKKHIGTTTYPSHRIFMKCLAANAIMAIGVYATRDSFILTPIIIGVVLYSASVLYLQILFPEDIHILKDWVLTR